MSVLKPGLCVSIKSSMSPFLFVLDRQWQFTFMLLVAITETRDFVMLLINFVVKVSDIVRNLLILKNAFEYGKNV